MHGSQTFGEGLAFPPEKRLVSVDEIPQFSAQVGVFFFIKNTVEGVGIACERDHPGFEQGHAREFVRDGKLPGVRPDPGFEFG